jgi:hypothetical protein
MSIDEKQSTSTEWTVDTLYIHLSRVINDLSHKFDRELEARDKLAKSDRQVLDVSIKAVEDKAGLAQVSSKEAVLKAENATEKRFESVNEFRSTLTDQANRLATKDEFKQFQNSVNGKMNELTARIGKIEDLKQGSEGSKTALIAGVTLVCLVLGVCFAGLLILVTYFHHA